MTSYIFIGLLGAVLALSFVYLVLRLRHWRDMYGSQREIYDSTLDQLLEAEREATEARQELAWLKSTVVSLAQRQAIAVMTDEQIHSLGQTMSQLVLAAKTPDRLN